MMGISQKFSLVLNSHFYLQFKAKDSRGREAVQFSFWGDWVQW